MLAFPPPEQEHFAPSKTVFFPWHFGRRLPHGVCAFFRLARGQWWPAANAYKGVVGVTIMEGLLGVMGLGWVEVALGQRFYISEWVIAAAFLALGLVNFYFLLDRKRGLNFERQFDELSPRKRLVLRWGAIGLIVGMFGLLFWSGEIYHQVFGIVPPTS